MPRPALLLPLLLLPAAALAQAPVSAAPLAGTRLTVSATGEARRTPDLVTIGAGVVTQAATAAQALADNGRATAAALAALRRAGVPERDVQTASVTLQPQFRYADNRPPQLTGYQASDRLTVRLHDPARAGATLDALVAAGINQIDGPSLEVEKPEPALDEARIAALATARARAALYARAAGLRVARIVAIDEGGAAEPPPRPFLAMAKMASAGDATPIAAGETRLAVTLQVVFELQ